MTNERKRQFLTSCKNSANMQIQQWQNSKSEKDQALCGRVAAAKSKGNKINNQHRQQKATYSLLQLKKQEQCWNITLGTAI